MVFAENSAEDLVLRGFSQAEIQERIGVDVGYHGRNFVDKLSGIDRKAYKVQYVREHCDEAKLSDVLSQYAKGLSKGKTLALMGIAGENIINLKWLFGELGMADAFKKADTKHRNTVMKDGMKDKYGVDNPFKLDEFQEAGKKTRKEKYGAEYTLQKESSLYEGAHATLVEHMADDDFREVVNAKREQTVMERYGVPHVMQSDEVKEKMSCTRKAARVKKLFSHYHYWDTESFIKAATFVHAGFYQYSKSVYTGPHGKVVITCPVHGDFEQDASRHLHGAGCPKCAGNVAYSVEQFIAVAKRVHGDEYDYSSVTDFANVFDNVTIICKVHGPFVQSVHGHLSGHGCPKCTAAHQVRTFQQNYGVDWPMQSADVRQKSVLTNRQKYGVDYVMQNQIISKRNYEAKKKNGTVITSSIEDSFADITGFDRQYHDDIRYPYHCDFYDASTDAFIEINASWTHGTHWFGSGNNDAGKLKMWKKNGSDYYMNAVHVWSERDVEKRECARRHHLNYVTLWDTNGTDVDLWLAMGRPVGHDYDREYSWLPERHITTDIDISRMKLSWGQLQAIVKDAQRGVFYEHEIAMWEDNRFRRNAWGTVRAFLYANRWKYIHKLPDELTDREILRGFRISGLYIGFTSFDPEMMKKVISKYGVKNVYDPCSGWGERMMTCGMLGVGYEGCDINCRLQAGYAKLAAKIDGFTPVMHVGDSARQTVETDADAVITCPPYMNMEIYSDGGAEHYDAKHFAAWWEEVVARCSAGKAKVFAVQTNQACRQVFLSGLENHGWRLAEELTYENERKSHFHRGGTRTKREFESMLVMIRLFTC